ncbi:MAG: bifunctional folylpolyglutamate synthase/dihydrofolate synthase [Bacteroidetes bacterium]|nr:bifunctional folylpolyglutamate synthase/dihydrofolate synthase [Bacteroidota bacterium]
MGKFKNYNQCIKFLFGLERAGIKYNLKNISSLLKFLGNPEKNFKSIHIAGTNGKGSVSGAVSSVLMEKGFITGLYTSPHILDFRERIHVNGKFISKKFIVDFVNRMYPEIIKTGPSFFEITTAMAFEYFSFKKTDYAVVETGLGGRLDATNVLLPVVSAITTIAIDHTEFLGKSIKKISGEKAGIIKKNIPVVIGNVNTVSRKIFTKYSRDMNSVIKFSEEHYKVSIIKSSETGFAFDIKSKTRNYKNLFIPVAGRYQMHNISTCLTILDTLSEKENIVFREKEIRAGYKNLKANSKFYGRFELISENPKIVIDVSHNLQGIENISENLKSFKYRNLIIIFGMMNDKQYRESVNELFRLNAKYIIFTKPKYKRSADPKDLLDSVPHKDSGYVIKKNVKEANEFYKTVRSKNDILVVTGSFFLVSDFLKLRDYRNIRQS